MPMLDLSALGGGSPFGGLLNLPASQGFPAAETPSDEAAKAQEARDAAAAILARKIKGQRNGPFEAPDENAPAVQFALGNIAPTPTPVDTRPLNPIEQKMMAGVGGGPPVPQPITYGSLAPQLPQPAPDASPAAVAPAITPPAPSIPLPQPRPSSAPAVPSTVDDTTMPANAQPTEGKQPASDESAPAVPGSSLFGRLQKGVSDNSNLLLGLASGFAGAPSLGAGMSRGFAGAAAGGQLDLKQAMQQGAIGPTFTALVKAGVPKEQALAAVYSPEMLKSVVQSYITDRGKKVQIIKDAMGNEHPYEVNQYPKDGEPVLKPIDLGNGAPGGAASTAEPSYDPVTKRDEGFLKTLDPTTAAAVKDIADGKLPGTGRNLQKLMPYVARYENGFDNTTYQARQNLQKSYFGGGEGGKALRAANTTIDHGIQLQKAIDDLHNYSTLPGFLNPVTGKIAEQYDKKYQDALARFKTNSELYSKELDFALTGKSTVSGQNHIREMFDPYGSPVKNKASLQQTLEMLQQRVNEHENTYNTGMSHKGTAPFDMLSRRADLEKMLGQDTGAGIKQESGAAGPRKTATGVTWSVQ